MGLPRFRHRLDRFARLTRARLGDLGLRPVVPPENSARTVTCAWLPRGVPATVLVRSLSRNHGVEMATGRGRWQDRIVRVGHLGLATSENELIQGLDALRDCLFQIGERSSLNVAAADDRVRGRDDQGVFGGVLVRPSRDTGRRAATGTLGLRA